MRTIKIDSAFLLAGALTAGIYFDAETADELEVRTLADALYRRADWQWAQNQGATVTHGWKPESGFLKYRWEGYYEAILLYILGLGSPRLLMLRFIYRVDHRSGSQPRTFVLPPANGASFTSTGNPI